MSKNKAEHVIREHFPIPERSTRYFSLFGKHKLDHTTQTRPPLAQISATAGAPAQTASRLQAEWTQPRTCSLDSAHARILFYTRALPALTPLDEYGYGTAASSAGQGVQSARLRAPITKWRIAEVLLVD